MADAEIVQNDLRPDLDDVYLKRDGSVVDLSNANDIEFHLSTKPEEGNIVLNEAGTIVDAVNGEVKYEWTDGDTDLDPRTYFWEIQVNWSNGDP